MTVYVLEVVHLYPEVDGLGYIYGVYSARELAEKAAKKIEPALREDLGQDIRGKDAFNLAISEFEME